MKCEYCKVDIHPANLICIANKPYHYLCADFITLEEFDKEPLTIFTIWQCMILGSIILGGGMAIYYAFKLGLSLAKLIRGLL